MFSIDNEDCDNILYFLVYKKIEYPGDGCCAEKWLLFLIKTINWFPPGVLSIRGIDNNTPYDILNDEHAGMEWFNQGAKLFRPH